MNTSIAKHLLTTLMTNGIVIENDDDGVSLRYVETEWNDEKYVMSLTTNDVLTLHRNNKQCFQIQIQSGEYSLIDIICLASHHLDGKDIFSYISK